MSVALVRLSVSVLSKKMANANAVPVAAAVVLLGEFFLPISTVKSVRMHGQKKQCAYGAGQSAVAAPAGTMPVVLGAGWPGVLLHEAVGHGLKAINRRGTSVFSGQVGELVASELCTVVDDGTMVDRRGSVAIDDEGTPGQYNVLIENGILKGYMQDTNSTRV